MARNGKGEILVVDDEPNAVKVLSAILTEEGYRVYESLDVASATSIINRENVDLVITDLKMPGRDGMDFFGFIRENKHDIPVIFLTAYGTVDSAVSAMLGGAFYYFIKPPDYVKLKDIISRAIRQKCMRQEIEMIEKTPGDAGEKNGLLGNTVEIRRIKDTIETIKDSSSTVLISGETGTGKELISRALHFCSKRKDTPFIAVNCAAIPKELIEAELFGCEKGAFTGAHARRIGKFEEASNGTIFLDEIGELDLGVQAKILRVLQEREIERLGSNRKIKVHCRVISSTNRDLKNEVKEGRFREDLFYRINVIEIKVPPLRERKEDIPLLASIFAREFSEKEQKKVGLPEKVMELLKEYHWPGNVRQLMNIIERAVVLTKSDSIALCDLPEEFHPLGKALEETHTVTRRGTLRDIELQAIKEALEKCDGNKSKAARMLGISRKAFYKRLNDAKHA
ncbi:MAG: sigma-54 dependent transcriptional regulator [Nitrospirota bacterium]|nr:sigma-54 dependent transcriptional regulator [Nitrospirota bacterium]